VLHEKVAWQRKDWLHKLSRDLANKYEFVIVEDINLQNMASNLGHGKAVGDQGFGMFRGMLGYKTNLIKVPAAYTSQTCHNCGFRKVDLTLSDREWTCPTCGETHDRDVNAALNILSAGISRSGNYRSQNADGVPRSTVKSESQKPSIQKMDSLKSRVYDA
jgi:putative transposase